MEKIFVLPDGVVEPSCYDDGNNILIVIPKETVRFAQENRDDTIIKITDLDSMAKDFILPSIPIQNISRFQNQRQSIMGAK